MSFLKARDMLLRCLRTLAVTAAVMASLLTFPGGIAWMIACWLGWFTLATLRGKAGWLQLAACFLVLVVKGSWDRGILAALSVIGVAALVVGLRRTWRPMGASSNVPRWSMIALVWLAWGAMAVDRHRTVTAGVLPALDLQRPVVCLGDSLTAGMPPDAGYPSELGRLLKPRVISLARAGITTQDVLRQLPEMQALRPQLVIIELGGHDYLKGKSRSETFANLEMIIVAAKAVDAAVILMEMPRGFVLDPYRGLERELARKHDLQLVSDGCIRQLVLWSPHAPPGMWTSGPYLSEDGLHPNAAGNRLLASTISSAVHRMYGPRICNKPRSRLPGGVRSGCSAD